MTQSLWGVLTLISYAAILVFSACAFVLVQRLLRREPTALSEEVGSATTVLRKVRKKEPMSADELAYATQIITDRGSFLAFCIPAVIISVGCIYVFGSLEQLHGRQPSIRTFIGLIPMLAGTNLTIQLLRVAKLKRRLPAVPVSAPAQQDSLLER
ncbi:hypothetical protein OG976_17000 [Mycobacterium sp. NBC_00419]|uniref:hypothetical protein n=1 Tax=Mycobacterium sp. NBC_00419 TaxID=2975989 RepID=UPI002E2451B4